MSKIALSNETEIKVVFDGMETSIPERDLITFIKDLYKSRPELIYDTVEEYELLVANFLELEEEVVNLKEEIENLKKKDGFVGR